MPNINDYLDWRGDIPFSVDPFNEVDSLILSELSYTDFDGIVPQNPRKLISVKKMQSMFFDKYDRDEIRSQVSLIKEAPFLLDKLIKSKRFENLKAACYVNDIRTDLDAQMSAVTFFPGDGTSFVAFRGTDTTLVGWKEDFNFSFKKKTEGQIRAVEYLNHIYKMRFIMPQYAQHSFEKIRVGGHSKGGNFAVFASAFCHEEIRKNIIEIYSHDGPGFIKQVTDSREYENVIPKVCSIMPEGSMIGVLLSNRIARKFIKSSGKGAMQHDALTWQVERNHFVQSESRTIGSVFFDETMQKWLSKISDEEKKDFTDAFFLVLESTGMTTYSEIVKNKMKAISEMHKAVKEMPRERQQEFNEILKLFLKTGREELQKSTKKV